MKPLNLSDVLLNPYYWLVAYALVANVATFVLYGVDKLKAKREMRRISEFTLLLWAVLGGSLGALIGMNVWRHKTQHWKFTIGVPLLVVVHLVLVGLLLWYLATPSAELPVQP